MPTCILPTASAAASAVVAETSTSPTLSLRRPLFRSLSSLPNLRLLTQNTWQSMRTSLSGAVKARAQFSDDMKNGKPSSMPIAKPLASEESISEFITQVSSLVKLVDSRDIVELQMKQLDCEILIRKKEAVIQASPPPYVTMQSPAAAQPVAATPSVSAAVAAPSAASPAAPPVPAPSKSSIPPLKSPMAGTFYRSPAPNAPPFVKVGDKVQKGQVLCIIEAMKLMNEIEADQSGTVVEVIAEDGKPVSLDSPLFVIQP